MLIAIAIGCTSPTFKEPPDASREGTDDAAMGGAPARPEGGATGSDGSPGTQGNGPDAAAQQDANLPEDDAGLTPFVSTLQVDEDAPLVTPLVTCEMDKASDLFALKANDKDGKPVLGIYFGTVPFTGPFTVVTSTMLEADECGLVLDYDGELYDGMKGGIVEHELVGLSRRITLQGLMVKAESGTIRTLSAALECDLF